MKNARTKKHMFPDISDSVFFRSWKERFLLFFIPLQHYIVWDAEARKGQPGFITIYYKKLRGKLYLYDMIMPYD